MKYFKEEGKRESTGTSLMYSFENCYVKQKTFVQVSLKIFLSVFLFFSFAVKAAYAQKYLLIKPKGIPAETETKAIRSLLSYKNVFYTEQEVKDLLQKMLFKLYDEAYLEASIDSLIADSSHWNAFIFIGRKFKTARIEPGNVAPEILSEAGFRRANYTDRFLNYRHITRVQEDILRYCENNGYPFASIALDSIQITGSVISARLLLEKNKQFKIDSVIIKGNKTSGAFIQNYLDIKPGDLYNEDKIRKISTRIKELPFVKETKPFIVEFSDNQCRLYLFLESTKVNQADGILGFLPDAETGRLSVTGQAHIRLQNTIGKGELLEVDWKKLQARTQDLNAMISYPFLFRTPFGVDAELNIYKRDTLYLDVNTNTGLHYLFTGNNFIKAFVKTKRSSLISVKGLESITVLPDYADISGTFYGVGFKQEVLDYRLNPRKGYKIILNGSAGNKTINKNSALNPVVYNNLDLKTAQYSFDMDLDVFLPLGERSVVNFGLTGASLFNNTNNFFFRNELYRIGGINNLRGFDEESISVSSYGVLTLEYRYLLEQHSNFYLFWDGAYYESNSFANYDHDTPFGFGAGVSFETKAGIFTFNYALGYQKNTLSDIRSAKIHFGIVNYF
jgi:outer membrane protein assembly factor BamA